MKLTYKKKAISLILILSGIFTTAYCQEPFKISSGDNVLEIGGIVSSYLNLRTYNAGVTPNYSKNTFKLKDARLDIHGHFGNDLDYHFQLDFGGWAAVYDPAAPLLDDAYFTYKGLRKLFNIRFGYGKVPYSLNSLIDHEWTPYWERPLVTKGDFFSRRDLGLRLSRAFWADRIEAYTGIYTGVGEYVLGGSNDPSGMFEYIGRVEIGYPERRTEHEAIIDTKNSSKPNFQIGLNARASNRSLPLGSGFISGETGALVDSPYNFKVVNGEKYIYGADISVEYKGFSVQAETHILKGTPQNATDPLLVGLPKTTTNGYFKAGGWYATANYFSKPLRSIFSVRYDELNANDLIAGKSQHLASAYCYQLRGFHSMVRVEWDRILNETESINISKYDNQFRIGWQFVIE